MARKKQSQSYSSKIAYLFLTFAVFVFANIYLSDFIIENYDSGLLFENPVLKLTYIKNSGAAFSILSQYPFAIIAISVTILVALFAFVIKHANTMSFYGIFWLDMIMSGKTKAEIVEFIDNKSKKELDDNTKENAEKKGEKLSENKLSVDELIKVAEEREKARLKYLDAVGMHEDFRY